MNWQRMAWLVLLSAVMTSTVCAQHSDLEMFDDGGRVAVEPRIADGEFGESPNPTYRADEPGLESDPDELAEHGETPLPGGALVGFDVQTFTLNGATKSLFYWDGTGSPDFASLASPHHLQVLDPTETFSMRFDGSAAAAGFDFALTADGSGPDPAGLLHSHLLFDLVDSTGTAVGSPAAGVYAFATTFSVAGLSDSEPVYWVLASGVDEDVHEAAVEYIYRSVGIVPEPGTLALTASALVFGFLRRNRPARI